MTIYSPFSSLDVLTTAQSHRSLWRRFIEALMEGRRRKAAGELAEYLRSHKHSLSDEVRAELARRCIVNIAPSGDVDAGSPQKARQHKSAQESPR